ncbi:hypothetical protein [Sphingomonas sp. CFBP 8760]|uniref:hypothetical protein n=1 Tax=Sphingomonas sp. CFBP 8760 TaxID=2775282 RepID=UPI00177EA751|nr:hypothetical protein [Sphingomonas sp. CFBP 8760]MBD8547575.1 hypothetical protein [Sphingomonas sp. CFBP 8760]
MSDDRKPGRVRLVSGSGGRTVTEATVAGAPVVVVTPATPSGKAKGGMKAALLPGALFLIGCIGGGVAIARLVP